MVPGHELIKIRERKNASSALLFVHGFTGDSRQTWQEFPRILAMEVAGLVIASDKLLLLADRIFLQRFCSGCSVQHSIARNFHSKTRLN
jgi:hypothetical protein